MNVVIEGVAVVLVVALVQAEARRVGWQAPILLLLIGIVGSFIPGVPAIGLDPNLVLFVVLPLLLYASAFAASVPAFRAQLRPIGLLAIGATLFTTLVVGYVTHLVVPGLPVMVGMVFGAIVAPTDAVAASAVGRQVGMPRRVLTMLEGESLFNDAAALTAYRVAVAAVVGGVFSPAAAIGQFVLATVGGVLIGGLVGWLAGRVRDRIANPLTDTAVSLLAPFLAFIPAEEAHTSGLVAVVVTGLYLGHRAPVLMDAESRLISQAVWQTIQYLLEGAVFLLIGLQLSGVVAGLGHYPPALLAGASAAAIATLVAARFAWVFPAAYLPRLLPRYRKREPRPPWQQPALVSWAGVRGVVSLAAAFALPLSLPGGAGFPYRDLLLFLTFVVIAATLLGQGLTLPAVVRRLGLPGPDPMRERLSEAAAQHTAASAALHRLDELLESEDPPPPVVERLRALTENRRLAAWERLSPTEAGTDRSEPPSAAYRRLRRAMLTTERDQFVRMRDEAASTSKPCSGCNATSTSKRPPCSASELGPRPGRGNTHARVAAAPRETHQPRRSLPCPPAPTSPRSAPWTRPPTPPPARNASSKATRTGCSCGNA
jgi:CPA1 family monovalent cation:H+ antiporter